MAFPIEVFAIEMPAARIVVATSFPPALVRMNAGRPMPDYDRLCVASWIACGFRVLAVNAPDEIPQLAARYNGVEFIPAQRTAQALFGRKTPFIAEIMSVLARQPEPVLGIVNSDLLFEPAPSWQDLEEAVTRRTLIAGQRLDVRSLSGGALHPYFPGFDCFFFDRAAAAELGKTRFSFSMGFPWWDYWFPLTLALRGYELRNLTQPSVLHLAHDSPEIARSRNWRRLGCEFARGILRELESATPPPNWENLIVLCRELARATDGSIDSGALDESIARLPEFAVPIIARAPLALGPGAVLPQSANSLFSDYFDNVANRAEAGRALHGAIWEEQQGRWDATRMLYQAALEKAPHDPGVLTACGNFFFRRGDMQRAVILLTRAVELAPDSSLLLNSLGSALGELGRDDEAIACFERALASAPLDGTSYYNLAAALYPKRRHSEVVRRLEIKLREGPEFPDGGSWLRRIREAMPDEGDPV